MGAHYIEETGDFRNGVTRTREDRGDPVLGTGPSPDEIHEASPGTVTIPCKHIQLGDFLILQGRPCQVIRISTSSTTGQYRYLGVDLFNRQLHEESSFISNPAPSVMVQTMLSPILKQYRVLYIQDGKIVAKTDTGDVKQSLAIIDQSNLHDRLTRAFGSGRGSIRALVINDNGQELVVDIKVVHGDRLGVDPTNRTGHKLQTIHAAVRTNDIKQVEKVLRNGVDINKVDSEGKTALFDAIENHHNDIINRLIKARININLPDNNGKTALDIAVSQSRLYLIAFTLLEQGAAPIVDPTGDISALLSAAADGKTGKVKRLLDKGVAPGCYDRLGYTALHEAACFGHYDTASLLIQRKANVNANITHGGATVLHAVVQRGREHRRFLGKSRGVTPRLGENHVKIMALLLKNGASIEPRLWSDGFTIRDLVSQELKKPETYQLAEQCCLQKMLVLLNKPQSEKGDIQVPSWPQLPYMGNPRADPFQSIQLHMHYHTSSRRNWSLKAPIRDFIYKEEGEICGIRKIQKLERRADDCDESNSEKTDHWRWVHLPANNKTWVEIPYFDAESLECFLNTQVCSDEDCRKNFARDKALRNHYLKFDNGPTCLHFPCTLDQSYYLSLNQWEDRAKDQVVVKHAKLQEELERKRPLQGTPTALSATPKKKQKRLLMVNQMWIWKIDSKTLITAFPNRRHPGRRPDLQAQMSKDLLENPPSTIGSTVSRMLKHATGFVDAPNNSGLDENLFHIFEQSIAYRAQKDANCYTTFHKLQQGLSELGKRKAASGGTNSHNTLRLYIEDEICNITSEVEHLREIKDIKDELGMIQRVLEYQKTFIGQYRDGQRDAQSIIDEGKPEIEQVLSLDDEMKKELALTIEDVDSRIAQVKALLAQASSVEGSLNHLLDLKQKQGNLIAVRDTRSLANEADDRAKSSAQQSKLLFIFTIVTVVFTPISFTSTFLAVPTREFPRGNGEEIAWGWWQVFIASLIAEAITFLFIALWLVPKWNISPITLPAKIWTRQKPQRAQVSKV